MTSAVRSFETSVLPGAVLLLGLLTPHVGHAEADPFTPSTWPLNISFTPSRLLAADFDNDGDADLLASGGSEEETYFLRNDRGFRFTPPRMLGVPFPSSAKVVDLDVDGRLDLVGLVNGRLVFCRGLGDGSFEDGRMLLEDRFVRSYALTDDDRDLRHDIVTLDGDGRTVRRFVELASTWATVESLSVGPGSTEIQVADLDGDSQDDILSHLPAANVVELFLRGGGGWVRSGHHSLFPGTEGLRLGDFDGDGTIDLVSSHGYVFSPGTTIEPGIAFHYGDGSGNFLPGAWAIRRDRARRMLAVDLEADGAVELVTSGAGVLKHAAHRAVTQRLLPLPFANSDVAVGDLDGDGVPDVAGGNGEPVGGIPECRFDQGHTITIIRGRPGGEFHAAPFTALAVPPGVLSVSRGDVDSDGLDDLIVGTRSSSGATALLARGEGRWETGSLPALEVPQGIRAMSLADCDLDGRLDLVVLPWESLELVIAFGDGNASFGRSRTIPLGSRRGVALVVSDLDADERPDLVVVTETRLGWAERDSLIVFRNGGPAGFEPWGVFPVLGRTRALGPRRMGDGRHEVGLALQPTTSPYRPLFQVLSFPGGGQPRLSGPMELPRLVQRIRGIDLDLDGEEEWVGLATDAHSIQPCGVFGGHLLHFVQDGDGVTSLDDTPTGETRVFSADLAIGDFDADGISDAIVTGEPQEARFLRGERTGFSISPPLLGLLSRNPVLAAGDFDDDRRLDLACLSGAGIESLVNTGDMPLGSQDLSSARVPSHRPTLQAPHLMTVRVGDGSGAKVREVVPASLRLDRSPVENWSLLGESEAPVGAGSACDSKADRRRVDVRDVRFTKSPVGSPPWRLTGRTEDGRAVSTTVCPGIGAGHAGKNTEESSFDGDLPRIIPSVTGHGGTVRLRLHAPAAGASATCAAYDARGRRVGALIQEVLRPGWNEIDLQAREGVEIQRAWPPGVYFLDVRIGGSRTTLRWIVLPTAP